MKKYFFTGLIILLPVVLTIMIFIFLFHFFTAPLAPFVNLLLDLIQSRLSLSLPEGVQIFLAQLIALFFLVIFIFFLGIIARWFLVRNFFQGLQHLLSRIPLIKTVYRVSREVFSALFSEEGKKAFKNPVLIPFPDKPNYSVGVRVGEVPAICQSQVKEPLVAVFTPTAPHPISGYLLFVSKNDALSIDITNEEMIKFLVSCGMILPDEH
jgi:uncharacterized membrane protein